MRAALQAHNVGRVYDDTPLWLQAGSLAVILAPTVALLPSDAGSARRTPPPRLSSGVALQPAASTTWAMRLAIHERSWSNPHSTVHYFMAGAYAAIAGVLLTVIALTLLREGRRAGWFAVLFVTLVGGPELTMNGPTGHLYHHIGLYGYVVAWLAALTIAYSPTFSPSRSTAALSTPS